MHYVQGAPPVGKPQFKIDHAVVIIPLAVLLWLPIIWVLGLHPIDGFNALLKAVFDWIATPPTQCPGI